MEEDRNLVLVIVWSTSCFICSLSFALFMRSYYESKPVGKQTLLDAINQDLTLSLTLAVGMTSVGNVSQLLGYCCISYCIFKKKIGPLLNYRQIWPVFDYARFFTYFNIFFYLHASVITRFVLVVQSQTSIFESLTDGQVQVVDFVIIKSADKCTYLPSCLIRTWLGLFRSSSATESISECFL